MHSGWDRAALAVELQALADVKFDLEVTGFSCAEIEIVLEGGSRTRTASVAKARRQKEIAAVPGTAGVSPASPQQAFGPPAVPAGLPHAESSPPISEPAAATRPGDTWRIERHCLLCVGPGDLTSVIDRLLDGERFVFVASEPALCDRVAAHFQQLCRYDATLAETGQDFTTVAAQRRKQRTKEQSR